MIRKIAFSGMKGRKKDTFLILFVMFLSFLFIVISTTLHSSSEKTKTEQRISMFGKWHAASYNANKDIIDELKNNNTVEQVGISRIIGYSSQLGTIGTFNDELIDMSSFKMHEGYFPINNNEIALELNQLSHFPRNINVGDIIPVEIEIPLYEISKNEARMEQMRRYEQDLIHMAESHNVEKPYNIDQLYKMFLGEITRVEQSLENFDGSKVVVKTTYLYASPPKDLVDQFSTKANPDTIEEVINNGTMISRKAYITRDMTISGIIQTYSNLWDVDNNVITNSFITEDAGKSFLENGFYLTKIIDATDYNTSYNIFIESNTTSEDFFNTYKEKINGLRRNTLAYPSSSGSTENTLTYGILAFIFLATIFSVFQIYLTQIKRRTRKMALLKSIGATNGQICGILLWEGIYLLVISLPIGLLSGLGLTKIIISLMNNQGETALNFYVETTLLLSGLIISVSALFIGMLLPMVMAVGVPLTGNISKPPKRLKTKNKVNPNSKDINFKTKILSFKRISLRYAKYNKNKNLLTLSLYSITISVLLFSIFLSYIFFKDYINNVIATNKPSYGYEVDYGMAKSEMPVILEKISSVDGVTGLTLFKAGEHAYLWYDKIEDNELWSTFKKLLPENLIKEHFGINNHDFVNIDKSNQHLVSNSIVTNIYGIDMDETFDIFNNSLTIGTIDKSKFEEGKEAIILIPHFRPLEKVNEDIYVLNDLLLNTNQKNRMKIILNSSNTYDINYDFRFSNYYDRDNSISLGENIYLTIPTENIKGDTKTNDVAFHEVKITGIINYFPDEGVWPFSGTIENPVIIGSYNLVGELYPSSIFGKGQYRMEDLRDMISSLTPTKFGKTWIYVETNKKVDKVQLHVDLQRIANENGFKLHNYKESNDAIYGKAFNFTCIILILGISIAIIALIILYNTTLSKIVQERERIGTLQALGVTNMDFRLLYIITGFIFGSVSIMIAHILLGITIFFNSIELIGLLSIKQILTKEMYLYPWKVHYITCISFLLITILTYYLPLRKIVSNEPIDNIRNLGR